jgi:anti-sigma regulatory factor (Ser/Thr protein kinase)
MSLEAIKTEEYFIGDKWILPTNIDLVTPAEDEFAERLGSAGWETISDEVLDLRTAFREALINAVAHGNLGVSIPDGSNEELGVLAKAEQERNPTNKKVYIDLNIDEKQATIVIRDEGNGFDWKNVADPLSPDGLLKPKGRGMLFMRAYADSITHNEKGNEVTIVKTKKS